jgi:hypothetical protein
MITGERRAYHRKKRFCDGLHIGIPGVGLGHPETERIVLYRADAVAADDKGPTPRVYAGTGT